MKMLTALLALGISTSALAAPEQFCKISYKTYSDNKTSDIIFYYELSIPKFENGKWSETITYQLDCEDADKKQKMLEKIRKECQSVNAGDISIPAESFTFTAACG